MPDTYDDPEGDRQTDPRFDAWPLVRYDAWANWPVEREVPGEEDTAPFERDAYWMGVVDAGTDEGVDPADAETPSEEVRRLDDESDAPTAYLYDPSGPAIVTGRVDEENERVVIEDESERHDLDSEGSLGQRLEEFGETHEWSWLSSFARKHLEGDAERSRGEEIEIRGTDFNRRNIAEGEPQDLDFVASHTFTDESDQVFTIEREFDVFAEGTTARTEVSEELLVAEAPHEDMRAGDAEVVGQQEFTLLFDVDTDDPAWENEVARQIKEWHRDRLIPGLTPPEEGAAR